MTKGVTTRNEIRLWMTPLRYLAFLFSSSYTDVILLPVLIIAISHCQLKYDSRVEMVEKVLTFVEEINYIAFMGYGHIKSNISTPESENVPFSLTHRHTHFVSSLIFF